MAKRELFRNDNNASAAYLMDDGHFIPQFDYIYDNTGTSDDLPPSFSLAPQKRRRIVNHVLKFETLRRDFHSLMSKYGNGMEQLIPLPRKRVRSSMDKKLGLYNLTLDNLQLIELIYKEDFEEFGYELQSTQIPVDILERNIILMKCNIWNWSADILLI